jgi:hypothetical protein
MDQSKRGRPNCEPRSFQKICVLCRSNQASEVTALPLLLLMFAVAEFSMQITWHVYTRYPTIANFCSMLRTFESYCPRKVFLRLGTAERPGQPAKKISLGFSQHLSPSRQLSLHHPSSSFW